MGGGGEGELDQVGGGRGYRLVGGEVELDQVGGGRGYRWVGVGGTGGWGVRWS